MKYDYDIIVIGLGPAGMAVSAMGAGMGLKVCAIERNKIGGECMNVGCIPSKSLLKMGRTQAVVNYFRKEGEVGKTVPDPGNPFARIKEHIDYIGNNKTRKMFDQVELVLQQGAASFVDQHTVRAGEKTYSAQRIYICTGTAPAVPPLPGIDQVDILTNENLFSLDHIPASMTIIGGGAIGCEMAQAFTELGCRCSIVQMDPHLIPAGDEDMGHLLEEEFSKMGIGVYNSRSITKVEKRGSQIALLTEQGDELVADKLLVAAGRRVPLDALNLDAAGVAYTKKGITVNHYLQTSVPHIYAPGDCNGHVLFSHAAMHQGMLALMNGMIPSPFKRKFNRYVVPWTVFTTPQVSQVGATRAQLEKDGVKFEEVTARYEDYGAAIAEDIALGYVSAYITSTGRILGAKIIGEGSGEMIGEWALAIQKKHRITDIMMLQHSFPTMSFLTKRVSEIWMMNKMKSNRLRALCRFMFRR
jgi:pyruvate/2-oxoglutarate dehydrogenase complex dihydrolipoamide dehydrogenase (E3) component